MTPDTAPEAITRGPFPDRSPHGEIGCIGSPDAYLIDPGVGSASDRVTRFWPHREMLDAVYRRGGEITPLYAPRLTSHSAGEWLREALAPFVRHWQPWMDATDASDDGSYNYSDDEPMSCFARVTYGDLRRARAALLTPPSDAGSTTRSGGEGVRQAAIRYMDAVKALGERSPGTPRTYFDEQPMSDEGSVRWKELNDAGVALTAALTTTSAPGPDPKLIYEALRFYVWAAGEGICPVDGENALEPEEGLFQYSNRTGDEEWETVAERYLATTPSPDASPDSGEARGYTDMRSGGRCDWQQLREAVSEAVRGTRDTTPFDPAFYPGHQSVEGINYNSLDRIVTAFVDAARPSPSPAIVKEAGEVEAWADLDRVPLSLLHKLQHTGSPLVKPQPGGSIIQWAADEITALRGAALDGNDIWEALFGILKGHVPDELTEEVCEQLAAALSASNAAQVSK